MRKRGLLVVCAGDNQESPPKTFPGFGEKDDENQRGKYYENKTNIRKNTRIGCCRRRSHRVSALKEVDGRVHFGIVTLLPASQNARLNFIRVDRLGEDPTTMQPCVIEVRIFDAAGRAYGMPDTFDLRPGIAVSRAVIPQGSTEIEGAFHFRATFKFVDDPNLRSRCEVIPTMEVFSKETGGTMLMYPAAKGFNPQPDPPGGIRK